MIRMPQPRHPQSWYDCIYDAWNRLVEIRDNGNLTARYEYDGLGRRIVKQTRDKQGQDRWRHYYYSAEGQVIEERESTTFEDVLLLSVTGINVVSAARLAGEAGPI